MKEHTLQSTNYTLHLKIFDHPTPKAIIKIIHGMTERQERYEDFAAFLNAHGYIVVTADLRGHGRYAPILSHIADRGGAQLLVSDEIVIRDWIKSQYPDLPMMLFCHSMGTLIARKILQNDSYMYSKVILTGYVRPQPEGSFGVFLTKLAGLFHSPKGRSPLLTAVSLGPFVAAIPNARPEEMKWISYNEENIAEFRADPFCGREFTVGSYNALFHLVADIAKPKKYRNVNAGLPILMIAGEDDPCTGFAKGRARSIAVLRRAGFNNLEFELFKGMRHELLHETDYQKVYDRILQFIMKNQT